MNNGDRKIAMRLYSCACRLEFLYPTNPADIERVATCAFISSKVSKIQQHILSEWCDGDISGVNEDLERLEKLLGIV